MSLHGSLILAPTKIGFSCVKSCFLYGARMSDPCRRTNKIQQGAMSLEWTSLSPGEPAPDLGYSLGLEGAPSPLKTYISDSGLDEWPHATG